MAAAPHEPRRWPLLEMENEPAALAVKEAGARVEELAKQNYMAAQRRKRQFAAVVCLGVCAVVGVIWVLAR